MKKGKLVLWNDEKVYGLIKSEAGGRDVFIHISALSDRNRPPKIGEVICFDLEADGQGKVRAVNARIENVAPPDPPGQSWTLTPLDQTQESAREAKHSHRRPEPPRKDGRSGNAQRPSRFLGNLLAVGLVVLSVLAATKFKPITRQFPAANLPAEEAAPQFHCEGKTRCQEMNSCEEIEFYQAHCPNTQMDGDHDGKPCEDRCGY